MIRALWTAGTGMTVQQTNLDVIANNIANVNTTGFKRSRADFQDLMYQTLRLAGAKSEGGNQVPSLRERIFSHNHHSTSSAVVMPGVMTAGEKASAMIAWATAATWG